MYQTKRRNEINTALRQIRKGGVNMSDTNTSSNRVAVPEAKEAMDKFKMEVANEIGVPLTNGYTAT